MDQNKIKLNEEKTKVIAVESENNVTKTLTTDLKINLGETTIGILGRVRNL